MRGGYSNIQMIGIQYQIFPKSELYRSGCSVGPGFTLLVHFSWQAILMFWMAAMAAVGREMEGGPIK